MDTLVATGNISPCRFLKVDTSADHSCAQASAGTDKIIGISAGDTRTPPITGLADGYHAIAGESVTLYNDVGDDDEIFIDAGGTIAAGDNLTADSSGKAVATTTSGNYVGARAKESAVSGQRVRVTPQFFKLP